MSEMLSVDEIIARLKFGECKSLSTKAGQRLLRTAPLTSDLNSAFWNSYKTDKAEWLSRGYGVSKYLGSWEVTHWMNQDGSVTEQAARAAATAREEAGEGALPCDWIPEDVTLDTEVATKLLEYQIPGALRLKRALLGMPAPEGIAQHQAIFAGMNGNALDASDTGTGKTFVSLIAAHELGMTPCVIAPLAVLPSWQRAAKFLGVRLGWVINYDKIRNGKSGLGRWDMSDRFKFDYLPGAKPLIIFDEVQKCKSPDTKQGAILRHAAEAKHQVLCLSATAAKDPTEMRNLGAAIGMHDGTLEGWREWCKKNGCKDGRYGLAYKEKRNKIALEKLHRQIFPLRGNRLRIADIPEFPETQIMAEAMDTGKTADISAAYAELERELTRIDEDTTIRGNQKTAQGLAAIMAARIAAEHGKLDLFEQIATDDLEEDHSVVIFLNFRAHIAEMAERLKTKCVIWGQQKAEDRQQFIDDFNADKERVIIVSLQAGGAGLSLHDLNGTYARSAIISPSYSAVDLKQALGRVHRAGAKTKSRQRIIFAAGTIEEEICTAMRTKLSNIDTLNDGELAPPSILRHVKFDGEQAEFAEVEA